MSRPPLRVAIVNDYEVVVRGLSSMLQPFADRVQVVELDSKLPVLRPVDITLFDSFGQMPVRESHLDDVLANERAGRVVVFTWNMHPDVVEYALSRGCRGYLDKSMGATGLVDALERVAEGEVVVSRAFVPEPPQDGVAAELEGDWPGRAEGLSPREAEVVVLITLGLTNEEIARRMYLSINSVKTYIRNAYRKMGVTRRSQAVRWGLEHRMTPAVMRDLVPNHDEPTGT